MAVKEEVVTLGDDRLWDMPYLYMTGHGDVRWSDFDREVLRRYLRRGGFRNNFV